MHGSLPQGMVSSVWSIMVPPIIVSSVWSLLVPQGTISSVWSILVPQGIKCMKCTLYQGGGGGEGQLTGGAQGPGERFDCSENCGEFLSLVWPCCWRDIFWYERLHKTSKIQVM